MKLRFDLYVNVQRRICTDANGNRLGGDEILEFFREEAGIICFHCMDNDGNPWPFAVSDSYEFGTARDWDPATAVDILSEDDQFNIDGDWDDADGVSQIDPTEGLICCRYNTNTDAYNTAFSENGEALDAGLYLKLIDPVNGNITLCQYATRYYNIRRTDGSVPPGVEEPEYMTAAQVIAFLATNYQGAWDTLTTYTEGQTVTHDGGFFLARRENTGSEPDIIGTTLDWALIAVPGEDGSQWYSSTSDPTAGVGANGDYWLNIASGGIWSKSGGTWTLLCTLNLDSWTVGGNDDVDAGTEVVDEFEVAVTCAVAWLVAIASEATAAMRTMWVTASLLRTDDLYAYSGSAFTVSYCEGPGPGDIGTVEPAGVFSVVYDSATGKLQLKATMTSDNWVAFCKRMEAYAS